MLSAYCSTKVHTSTGKTPYELVFERDRRTWVSELLSGGDEAPASSPSAEAEDNDHEAQSLGRPNLSEMMRKPD